MNNDAIVYVVDDDESVRIALQRLVRSSGLTVEVFSSADEFLERNPRDAPSCAVLDLAMPGMDGLELQAQIREQSLPMGVVFLTGQGDIPASVRAMKHGAADFLTKPVDADALLAAVDAALLEQTRLRQERLDQARIMERFGLLSPREREVMEFVVKGLLNKQIAAELGISEKTVKAHRANVMHKTGVRSVAELVRLKIASQRSL